jgi:hypothetical protein
MMKLLQGWMALFLLLCTPLAAVSSHAQTITKATVNFHTTSQGKDGDSQVRDRIVCNGADFLQLFCCSSGNHGSDVWNSNTDNSRDMKIVTPLTKVQIQGCQFVAGLTANGNDEWSAVYTLSLTFSDGTQSSFSFGEIDLNSHHSTLVEVTNPIK